MLNRELQTLRAQLGAGNASVAASFAKMRPPLSTRNATAPQNYPNPKIMSNTARILADNRVDQSVRSEIISNQAIFLSND